MQVFDAGRRAPANNADVPQSRWPLAGHTKRPADDSAPGVPESKKAKGSGPLQVQAELCDAVAQQDVERLHLCVNRGASVHAPHPDHGTLPIHTAICFRGNSAIFQAVMGYRPDLNVQAATVMQLTPLEIAVANADVEGVRRLLAGGASLGPTPYWAHAPYSVAACVEADDVQAEALGQIYGLLEAAAKLRPDYEPPPEQGQGSGA